MFFSESIDSLYFSMSLLRREKSKLDKQHWKDLSSKYNTYRKSSYKDLCVYSHVYV